MSMNEFYAAFEQQQIKEILEGQKDLVADSYMEERLDVSYFDVDHTFDIFNPTIESLGLSLTGEKIKSHFMMELTCSDVDVVKKMAKKMETKAMEKKLKDIYDEADYLAAEIQCYTPLSTRK